MSSVVKGVSKVFRAVTSSPLAIVGGALALGAVLVTGGAALGLAPMALGAGGATGAVAGTSAVSSTLGSIFTSAATQGAIGALVGGGVSAATGGDVAKGALVGAGVGALTGGVTGAIGSTASGVTSAPTASGAGLSPGAEVGRAASGLGVGAADLGTAANGAGSDFISGAGVGMQPSTDLTLNTGTPPPAAPSTGLGAGLGGMVDSAGNFIKNNQTLVGSALGGVGQGAMAYFGAQEQAAAQAAQFEKIRQSYNTGPMYTRPGGEGGTAGGNGILNNKGGLGTRYRYDPETKRIERN